MLREGFLVFLAGSVIKTLRYIACFCAFFVYTVSLYPNDIGLDPVLARELSKAGIDPGGLSSEYNFIDGNFELSRKLKQAVNEGLLFRHDPQLRRQLKNTLRTEPLFLSPWEMSENASIISQSTNSFAELRSAVNKDVFLAQTFIFKNRKAKISFDLYTINTSPYDTLEIKVADAITPAGFAQPREIVLASYRLSKSGGKTSLSIDLSRHKQFQDFLALGPSRLLRVSFNFAAKRTDAKIRLDNIKIIYKKR